MNEMDIPSYVSTFQRTSTVLVSYQTMGPLSKARPDSSLVRAQRAPVIQNHRLQTALHRPEGIDFRIQKTPIVKSTRSMFSRSVLKFKQFRSLKQPFARHSNLLRFLTLSKKKAAVGSSPFELSLHPISKCRR